jgi:hypothetical protein
MITATTMKIPEMGRNSIKGMSSVLYHGVLIVAWNRPIGILPAALPM